MTRDAAARSVEHAILNYARAARKCGIVVFLVSVSIGQQHIGSFFTHRCLLHHTGSVHGILRTTAGVVLGNSQLKRPASLQEY
jgi:hypothetical protein